MVLPDGPCATPYARPRWPMRRAYLVDFETRFAVSVLEVPLLNVEALSLERLGELLNRTLAPTALVA